ncbi:MAG: PAS domain S-box-containing protein [Gammaproteobacteria bacterium]|jgi:PAS domain S-box-containing protein
MPDTANPFANPRVVLAQTSGAWPLWAKFVLPFAAIGLLLFIALSAWLNATEARYLESAVYRAGRQAATELASAVSAPLRAGDTNEVTRIARASVARNPALLCAEVYDTNGSPVVQWLEATPEQMARTIRLAQQVHAEGRVVGQIRILTDAQFDQTAIAQRMHDERVALLGILASFCALTLVLCRRYVGKPTQALSRRATELIRGTASGDGRGARSREFDNLHCDPQSVADLLVAKDTRERELQKIQGLLQSVLAAVGEGIITIDASGTVLMVNPEAQRIWGYTEAELKGKKLNDLMPQRYRAAHNEGLAKDTNERPTQVLGNWVERCGLHRDGHEFPLEIYTSEVQTAEGQFFTGAVRDISERKREEDELKAALAQADSANRTKGIFLATMSHEIRTPLNVILNALDLLKGSTTDDAADQLVDRATLSGKNLLFFINDILGLSSIEADMLELNPTSMQVSGLVDDLLSLFGQQASDKGISLTASVAENAHGTTSLDADRLKQVLRNLLGNAIKFTESGSICLAIHRIPGTSDELHFSVTDTGVGLDEEQFPERCKEFTQADNTDSRTHAGAGLGLSIAIRRLNAMGSKLVCSSRPDVGTGFSFALALTEWRVVLGKPDNRGNTSLPSLRQPERCHPWAQGRTVLLVEDSVGNRMVVGEILRRAGFDVIEAQDGARAVEVFRNNPVHDILMDLRMPVMDGIKATREIRALATPSTQPRIIAPTASAVSGDSNACKFAGMDAYLSKPVSARLLLDTLRYPHTTEAISATTTDNCEASSSPVLDEDCLETLHADVDAEPFAGVIKALVKEMSQRYSTLNTYTPDRYSLEIAHEAHAIVGLARTCGLILLSEYAQALERACSEDVPDTVLHSLEALGQQGVQGIDALRAHPLVASVDLESTWLRPEQKGLRAGGRT